MAVTDEILTRYKLDIQQPEQAMNKFATTLVQTEETGEKAFSGIGHAADQSAAHISNVGRIAEKSKGQFNQLGNSINQISRELPAFTMNLNTGFLAISNNLPALSDAIGQLKRQNAELAAQGKQTQSVLGAVASALFSWQTALSIGITLLTAYGGKIIDFIAGNKEAKKTEEELRKEQEKHNEEMMRGVELLNAINIARGKEIKGLQTVRGFRRGGIELQKFELDLLRAKGATDQEIFDKEQEIRANEIIDLKELMIAYELYGDDRLNVQRQIDAKVREIDLAKQKFDAEQAEKARKAAEELESELAKIQKIKDKRAEDDRKRQEKDEAFERALLEKRAKTARDLQAATLKALDDKYKANRKREEDRLKDELNFSQTSFDRRQEILEEQLEKGFITQNEYKDAILSIENAKKMAALDTISSVASALGSFAQILGQNTEAGKALAIAQTTIDTYVAAQKAYLSQLQFDPTSPIRATIAAAAAVASGLARVAAISATPVPKPAAPKQVPTGEARGFRSGVVDLDGPGTATSDSIPVWLSKGESVITARSTSAKRDDLIALNKGVTDYETLLYKKYVKPAVDAEQDKQNQFAANIARSIAMYSSFSDARIVKAIEKNKPATSRDISKLADSISKQNRISKFESNLKQPK